MLIVVICEYFGIWHTQRQT